MAAVSDRDTTPELRLRRALHALGYRYRLHGSYLPGSPDIIFPSKRRVIFVHGCFWHRHHCKAGRSMPKTRSDYWSAKFDDNARRDRSTLKRIRRSGWRAVVVWECMLEDAEIDRTLKRVVSFLQN